MDVAGIHVGLGEALTRELTGLVQRVSQSVVVVQSGRRGAGAGIIWRPNGVVVTNHHVIARGDPRVILSDDREFQGRVIASDPAVDLAVVQIDALGLPAASIADSRRARVGQLVLAIGHPWGQRATVTAGIISGLGISREHAARGGIPVIRSDVGLAPGNSGGPLVDATGAVIGINAMIVGGDLSLAIPSHLAEALVADALDRRTSLGVGVRAIPLPPAILGQAAGLLVVETAPDGPAERAGILPGDILVTLGDVSLDGPRALIRALATRQPGERVSLRLLRGGRWQQAEAELASHEWAA